MRRIALSVSLLVLAVAWCGLAGAQEAAQEKAVQELRAEIAEKGYTFEVAANPATAYTIDQLCGLKPPPDWLRIAKTREIPVTKDLPSHFDWRDRDAVTPIKDQEACGSCWAFATVGILESRILVEGGPKENLSEQYLVSCNDDDWGCKNGGWWAHDYHVVDGAVRESCYRYIARDSVCRCDCRHPYRVTEWYYVTEESSVPSVDAIKQAIHTYGPIAVAVYVDRAFVYYSGGVFNSSAQGEVNHAVILIGWDDPGGYWIMKNSWGIGWGEMGGYMRIKWGAHQIGYAANYVAGYEAGDWPPDTDCKNGGCKGSMAASAAALASFDQLRSAYSRNALIAAIDAVSRDYGDEIQVIVARNPMIRHLFQRGLWTNLTAIQAQLIGTARNQTLDATDFLRAINLARPLVSQGLATKLDSIAGLLRAANGRPISEVSKASFYNRHQPGGAGTK
jgi:C1A family cysteine protease